MEPKSSDQFAKELEASNLLEWTLFGPSKILDENLATFMDSLSTKYQIPSLSGILFTIAKDLILNGFKANFKRLFFQENQLDILNPADYELGVRMYRSLIQSGKSYQLSPLAEKENLWVKFRTWHSKSEIKFEIRNNTSLVRAEMQKIRNSLLFAQSYTDIMEYYIERGDNSEGEGIGIALCIILLKGENLPTDGFKIYHEDGETIASLQIPLPKY